MSDNYTKKTLVTTLSALPNVADLKDLKLSLLTANGIIIGTYVDPQKADYGDVKNAVIKGTFEYSGKAAQNTGSNISDNDYVCLEDVTVINGSYNTIFDFLIVFTDQIIAATICKPE